MRWPLYFVSNTIKNSLHRVSLMPLDGCRRFGAIEFERHDNHEKTIQLYPGTVRVREAFVLRSIEVYPWFNDLVTACFQKIYFRNPFRGSDFLLSRRVQTLKTSPKTHDRSVFHRSSFFPGERTLMTYR